MFRCQVCSRVVPAGTRACRIVVERRHKGYPFRAKTHRVVVRQRNGKPKVVYKDDPGGEGDEIVREMLVCPECARRHADG